MPVASSSIRLNDSAAVREFLRVALESDGYNLEAADGKEGVRVYRDHHPALVIADIVMPEKDGIEVVREILAINPAAIIFTMSGRDEDYQYVARMLGAKRVFRKPIRMVELLHAIRALLGDGVRPI